MSLGAIFIWFGILKPFGISPAQGRAEATVYWFPSEFFVPILGWWEVAIGVCLIVLPLILLPDICFTSVPYGLTLEGQYIIKNLALLSAALVVGGGVRSEGRQSGDQQL